MRKSNQPIIAIDPGITGAIVFLNGFDTVQTWPIPIRKNNGANEVDFDGIHEILFDLSRLEPYIYCELALPMAMGSASAFSYGRGFAAIEIAIELLDLPVTFVHPKDWTKVMHEGISNDIKPKAKSAIAIKRNFAQYIPSLPKNRKGVLKDGPVDALLIALYGRQVGDLKDNYFK